ncbi:MAG: hypothetical protein FVQ85_04520 [Planctomycetes bacterium]|nr:hypothetical protein [Planctomycetota bacterium]
MGFITHTFGGDQVIAEYEADTVVRKHIFGPGIDEPICMIVSGVGTYYYHFDGLGSVAALSNSSGNMVERYSYDVFGEPNRTSSIGNPYMFTGRRYEPDSGLYYYRARYYSPQIGRFLQTDPIGYVDSMNLYTYVVNNPINLNDPTGKIIAKIIHCAICLWKLGSFDYDEDCGPEPTQPDPSDCSVAGLEKDLLYLKELKKWQVNCINQIKKLIPSCGKCAWAIPTPGK